MLCKIYVHKPNNSSNLDSNNFKLSIHNEYNNENSEEAQPNSPFINFKKLSHHIIDLSIDKISLKITEDEDKKLNE